MNHNAESLRRLGIIERDRRLARSLLLASEVIDAVVEWSRADTGRVAQRHHFHILRQLAIRLKEVPKEPKR